MAGRLGRAGVESGAIGTSGGSSVAALLTCDSFAGGTLLLEADPAILTLRDAMFVPFGDPVSPVGIFDHGQKMVFQSWYFRGPDPLAGLHALGTPYRLETVSDWAADELYVYGGWLHEHFGHFLLSSLSRFWSRLWEAHPTAKILVHAPLAIDAMFERDWFATLMRGLGIARDRLVSFDRATKIRTLLVSAPSFEEENFVHTAYARFCNALGRRIAAPLIGPPDPRPVFLSKEKLSKGVQRLENESAVSQALARAGVEIVYPETLSFEEQIALWYNRPNVISFANSALHTSIFAPGRNILVISYGQSLMSNYVLVDKANRTTARYFRPVPGSITTHGTRGGFVTAHEAHDPEAIAADVLRALDVQLRAEAARRAATMQGDHLGELVNVAIDKPATQSSNHPNVPFKSIGATSGFLTGAFQFHTANEQEPWWEVDLQATARISLIRLFNRADIAQERCACFTISARRDGEQSAVILHDQTEPCRFGGLDGHPFEWIAREPIEARYVRIGLRGRNYLHLDQVEILGRMEGSGVRSLAARAPQHTA